MLAATELLNQLAKKHQCHSPGDLLSAPPARPAPKLAGINVACLQQDYRGRPLVSRDAASERRIAESEQMQCTVDGCVSQIEDT
jgi:hypothetical protein